MKANLKTVFVWLMILVLGYNLGGYFVVFEISESINKELIHELISENNSDNLTLLKIASPSALVRKDDDEIIYEGSHYDVKKEFVKSGVTYFYCIQDKNEDDHYASLNSSVTNNSSPQNEKQNSSHFDFQKHLVKDYFFHDSSIAFPPHQTAINTVYFTEYYLSSVIFNILTPPPKSLVS